MVLQLVDGPTNVGPEFKEGGPSGQMSRCPSFVAYEDNESIYIQLFAKSNKVALGQLGSSTVRIHTNQSKSQITRHR